MSCRQYWKSSRWPKNHHAEKSKLKQFSESKKLHQDFSLNKLSFFTVSKMHFTKAGSLCYSFQCAQQIWSSMKHQALSPLPLIQETIHSTRHVAGILQGNKDTVLSSQYQTIILNVVVALLARVIIWKFRIASVIKRCLENYVVRQGIFL